MTRTEQRYAKVNDLWNDRNKAFEQAQYFPSSYYQRHYLSLERKLWAYVAKYGPFVLTFTNGHTLEVGGESAS